MVKHTIRCGDSNTTYRESQRPAPTGRKPVVPKRTAIHIGSPLPAVREFRVIARLTNGSTALVCVGDTRQEAVELVRKSWERGHERVETLFLERWIVVEAAGGWVSLRAAKGELPEKPRFRRRSGKKEARKVSANGG